jgi:hypothetical protein
MMTPEPRQAGTIEEYEGHGVFVRHGLKAAEVLERRFGITPFFASDGIRRTSGGAPAHNVFR